jgi:spore germination protein GerM
MKNLISAVLILTIFSAAVAAQKNQALTIRVYFLNIKLDPNLEDCRRVHPVARKIPKTDAVARAALEELFKGVTPVEKAEGYVSFSPEETKGILKSIKVKNGAAYINFNKTVYRQMGNATTSCGGGFFSSVENTLKQCPTIKKVFYAIETRPRDFYDWVQVGQCPKELRNCSGKDF